MLKLITEDNINLTEFPSVTPIKQTKDIIIGDLHANALKLIYILIKFGIFKNISAEDYQQLVQLYSLKTHTTHTLKNWSNIISRASIKSNMTLLLLGDELFDRGANDELMRLLLQHLIAKTTVEINISNHGLGFINAYERNFKITRNRFASIRLLNGSATVSSPPQVELLQNKIITKRDLIAFYETAYLPSLKLINYRVEDNQLFLMTHAGIGLTKIKNLAESFDINYRDETLSELTNTIDAINDVALHHLQQKTFYSALGGTQHKVYPFLWNRNYEKLVRPMHHHDYLIHFIHGHDDKDPIANIGLNIYNLDDHVGKAALTRANSLTVLINQLPGAQLKLFDKPDTDQAKYNFRYSKKQKLRFT